MDSLGSILGILVNALVDSLEENVHCHLRRHTWHLWECRFYFSLGFFLT